MSLLCSKDVEQRDLSFYNWYQKNKHLAKQRNPTTGQSPFLYYRWVGFPSEGAVCNRCMELRMSLEGDSKKNIAELIELSEKIYGSSVTDKHCGICGNKAIYSFSSFIGSGPEAICGTCAEGVLQDTWHETYVEIAKEWFDKFTKMDYLFRNAFRFGYPSTDSVESIQTAIKETEEAMAGMKEKDPFVDVTENYSYMQALRHKEDLLKRLEDIKIKEQINQKKTEVIKLIDKNEFQKALPLIQEVIEGEGTKSSLHLLFRVYNELGEYDKIEEDSIKSFNNHREDYWSEVLWKYYKTENFKDGMALAKKLMKKTGNIRAWHAYLSILKEEKPKAFPKELSKALKKFPEVSNLKF
ncbi:MAG: hypothetical protein ACTSR8_12795 [Promethearchaeota archaeon]